MMSKEAKRILRALQKFPQAAKRTLWTLQKSCPILQTASTAAAMHPYYSNALPGDGLVMIAP